jgi:hypothetical protein
MKFAWYTGWAHTKIQTTSISLWLYSPYGPWPVYEFLNLTQLVGLLGRGISPSQGRYLHTEQHKYIINAHRHPCLEWYSNPLFEGAKTVQARPRCHCYLPHTDCYYWCYHYCTITMSVLSPVSHSSCLLPANLTGVVSPLTLVSHLHLVSN